MSGSIKKIIATGTARLSDPIKIKKVKLLNIFLLIRMILSVWFMIEDYLFPQFPFQYSVMIHTGMMLFIFGLLVLQHHGKYILSCSLFLLVIYSEVLFFAYVLEAGMGVEYFYLAFPLVALIFFDRRDLNLFFLALAMACFFVPKIWLAEGADIPFTALPLFITLYSVVSYFKNLNTKNEELLSAQRNKAVEAYQLIEKQKSELEELHNYQKRFFENVAHEIRTPLTILKGTLPQVLTDPEIKQGQPTSVVDGQINRLEGIVNDVIDLSKMTTRHFSLNKELINVSELVHNTWVHFQSSFFNKGLDYHLRDQTDRNLLIMADPIYLERSINNLFSNALKYTEEGGKVRVIIRQDGDHVEIAVEDTGIGIPPDQQSKIFDQFYQIDNSINQAGGSGIGLAYAHEIITMHEGSLTVESSEGNGATFRITLPVDSVSHSSFNSTNQYVANTKPVGHSTSRTSLPQMLVVEDQPELRKLIASLFPEYQCVEASNGVEGLEKIQDQHFEVILVDYMMPKMNGKEFIEELKARQVKTPIIVLTALSDSSTRLSMLELGIDDFLPKPFEPQELRVRVNNSVQNTKQRNEFLQDVPEVNADKEFLDDLTQFILKNCRHKTITVDLLCNEFAMSASSLYRKVKAASGLGTREFITEVRLHKARTVRQQQPELNNKQLAELVGWKNQTHFSQLYEKRFGVSI